MMMNPAFDFKSRRSLAALAALAIGEPAKATDEIHVSDRWVVKTIIGYAFPVPGGSSKPSEPEATGPVNPMSHTTQRT